MDKSVIEKYKSEMMNMYRSAVPATAVKTAAAVDMPTDTFEDGIGKLIVTVTTVRALYPLENARVTVFTGELDNMQISAEDMTDQSGRTKAFKLKAPKRSISLSSQPDGKPYASYNIQVKAEGYTDSVYLNVPVFSGVTSVQPVNMQLLETAGKDKGPIIFDEGQKYTLEAPEE